MKKFWMLLVDGTETCRKRHYALVEARQEAERLARQEGRTVALLEMVEYCEIAPSPVEWEVAKDEWTETNGG